MENSLKISSKECLYEYPNHCTISITLKGKTPGVIGKELPCFLQQQGLDLLKKGGADHTASMLIDFFASNDVSMSTSQESRPNLVPISLEEFHQEGQIKFAGKIVARVNRRKGMPFLIAENGLLQKSIQRRQTNRRTKVFRRPRPYAKQQWKSV